MLDQEINEQLGLLQNELIRLKTVTDYLDNAKENSESIIIELEKVQVNYTNYTENIFNLYKQYILELKLNTETQINEGVTKFETTGDKIDKTNSDKLNEIKRLLDQYKHLVDATNDLVKTLENVDFPKRLDKLDANLAGIISAVQSIQGRLDIVERNLSDKIRDIMDYQKETRINIQKELEQNKLILQAAVDNAAKKQHTFTYITWILVIIATIITFFLKK